MKVQSDWAREAGLAEAKRQVKTMIDVANKLEESKVTEFKIVIGDWSNDGHNQSDFFKYKANAGLTEMRMAYLKSCEKTGLKFHGHDKESICCEYEDNTISKTSYSKMLALGYNDPFDPAQELSEDNDRYYLDDPEHLSDIIMWFISLSMPETFTWKLLKEDVPCLNGFWNEELNEGFGYGLYY